jgi:hypothetical protein
LVHRHRVDRGGQQRQQSVEAAQRLTPGMQQDDRDPGAITLGDIGCRQARPKSDRPTVLGMTHISIVCATGQRPQTAAWPPSWRAVHR